MSAVTDLLAEWLPAQRWFAGKGRPVAQVRDRALPLDGADPGLEMHVVQVTYADGEDETYCVPLTVHSGPDEELSYALVGEVERSGRPHWIYDAARDRETTGRWLLLMAAAAERGPVRFRPEPGTELPRDELGDLITTEQSNSSLVFGEQVILKLFRRIEPGRNPDVEVHEALLRTGNPHVAAMLGYVELAGDVPAAEPTTLAMAQTFLPSASDGFSLALASMRDLLAEADLHADEVGGDFAPEAHRLGQATASVHADLARVMPTERLAADDLVAVAATLTARLDAAVQALPPLAAHAAALRAKYDRLRRLDTAVDVQRVHGDLHLGQVLRTATGWTLLDFEGEPARPMPARRDLDSPLRDVAGMLRSFDYASRALLIEESGTSADSQLHYRAQEWAARNSGAFCEGYAELAGFDPRDQQVLLDALVADKAVYEAVYESRTRPRWLSIPLQALDRICEVGP